jgi:hypothetical protein
MEPSWQKLKLVALDAKPVGLWTLVADYVPGSRLLRFKVVAQDAQGLAVQNVWSPIKGTDCGADGIPITPAKAGLLSTGALYGALIAKVGGSSADLPDSTSLTAPYGTKRVFAVGSHCVVSLGSTEGGPLFLTMNDTPDGFVHHSGALYILIEAYSM